VYEKELIEAKKNNSRKPTKLNALALIEENSIDIPNAWAITTPEFIASPVRYSLAIGPFGSNLKVSDYRNEGVPLIFVRHIKSNDFVGQNPKYVSEEKAVELIPHIVEPCDLLITKMGEPPGDCEIYPENMPTAIITADCLRFKVWDKYFNRFFFKHLINSSLIKEQLGIITQGVAQQKISLERFKTLNFPVPPIEEQNEIVRQVEQLFAFADKIESRYLKAKAMLDKLPQSILAKAFRGELVPQDPNDEPASVLLERIKAEKGVVIKSKGKR
jgi:type I restriction enzyme S subunit